MNRFALRTITAAATAAGAFAIMALLLDLDSGVQLLVALVASLALASVAAGLIGRASSE